jgi:hypothetical protein
MYIANQKMLRKTLYLPFPYPLVYEGNHMMRSGGPYNWAISMGPTKEKISGTGPVSGLTQATRAQGMVNPCSGSYVGKVSRKKVFT